MFTAYEDLRTHRPPAVHLFGALLYDAFAALWRRSRSREFRFAYTHVPARFHGGLCCRETGSRNNGAKNGVLTASKSERQEWLFMASVR